MKYGCGTDTYANGTIFIGSYKKGMREGYGKLTMKNGTEYEGEFK